MTPRLGTLLDWSFADLIFLAIAVQQYVSITRSIRRDKEKAAAAQITSAETGHPEGQ